jgi:hypothetical protein
VADFFPEGLNRSGRDFITRLRVAPLGILFLAALLAIIGIGSIAGGCYLLLVSGSLSTWAAGTALMAGPAILYLTYHLVGLAHWTWRALMVLIGLLVVSSIVRIAVTPGFAAGPVVEITLETLFAAYLLRPTVRRRFATR